ncbi:MAG TPA: cupredoxin domain-containing protein [Anaerolineae bacterium]
MIRRASAILLVALVVTLALSGCNGGSAGTPASKAFSVEATEFAFSPNAFTAKVGDEITFNITNKGTIEHNFVLFDPSGKEIGRAAIAIGQSTSVKIKPAAAGEYLIECDIPGHKDAGMTAKLTVSP